MPDAPPAQPTLSPRYYRDHFAFLLDWMERHYTPVLNEEERDFIRGFRDLPEEAQCLYVRLANRSGPCFRVSKLAYPEIHDVPGALKMLHQAGFVRPVCPGRPDDIRDTLTSFTRPELQAALAHTPIDLPRSLRKSEQVQALVDHAEVGPLLFLLMAEDEVVFQQHSETVTWLNFLFFGNTHENTTLFVMRDLGHLQVEARDGIVFTPRYANRSEALDCFAASRARRRLGQLLEKKNVPGALDFFTAWHRDHIQLAEAARPRRDKMVLSLGAALEKQAMPDQALSIYEMTDAPPSRERRVRILYAARRVEEAYALAEDMQQDPRSAEEVVFAADVLTRKQLPRSVKQTSILLRRAHTIKLDGAYRNRVEHGVLAYFQEQEKQGFFAENRPWRNLFGLLCWEALFPEQEAVLHHPLQTAPADLFHRDFFARREEALTACLAVLDDQNRTLQRIERIHTQHRGQSHAFVDWAPESLEQAVEMCTRLPGPGLRAVLLEMARNIRENTRGFPDLFIWSGQEAEWVEVKGPKDTLSARQLCWLNFFNEHGLPARVLKVKWKAGT